MPPLALQVQKGELLTVTPYPTSANPAAVLVPDIMAGRAIMHVIRSVLVPRLLVGARPGPCLPFGEVLLLQQQRCARE